MKYNFTIITPCSRYENLPKLKESIKEGLDNFNVKWIIVYDSKKGEKQNPFQDEWIEFYNYSDKNSVSGNGQRNFALNKINTETWVYFLDDDNIIHENLWQVLSSEDIDEINNLIEDDNINLIAFHQIMENGDVRYAIEDNMKVFHIDQAQYIVHSSLLKDKRFQQKYEADGLMLEELYYDDESVPVFIDDILCYYNRLVWK